MSYFVFGSIPCQEPIADEMAWKIVQEGHRQGLYVVLWPNILQKMLLDMLDEHGEKRDGQKGYLFMLTGSPLCDTSDSLISPGPFYGVDYREKWMEHLFGNLKHMQAWMGSILTFDDLECVRLYMTQGYDNEFERAATNVAGFRDVVAALLEPHGAYVPSVRVEVTR